MNAGSKDYERLRAELEAARARIAQLEAASRTHLEMALRYSEERFRFLVEATSDWVWAVDRNGCYIYASPKVRDLLGYEPQEVLGRQPFDFMPPQEAQRVRQLFAGILESRQPIEKLENINLHKTGRRVVLETSGVPVFDEAGNVVGYRGIDRDITDRKQAEEALRQSHEQLKIVNETLEQRVAERTALAEEQAAQLRMLASQLTVAEQRERRRIAHILHEHLQQLLVGVKHRLGRARSHTREAPLLEQLQQAEAILGQAIQASRSLTVELCPPVLYDLGLAAALQWLGRWMHEQHGLTVRVRADGQADPQAEDVRVLLFQAVRELLLNVIKHAGTDRAGVKMSLDPDGRIRIVVADEGRGFDPSRLRLRKGSNPGFGLFSIKERLKLLNADLQVDSAPGQGTRITLVSPR